MAHLLNPGASHQGHTLCSVFLTGMNSSATFSQSVVHASRGTNVGSSKGRHGAEAPRLSKTTEQCSLLPRGRGAPHGFSVSRLPSTAHAHWLHLALGPFSLSSAT